MSSNTILSKTSQSILVPIPSIFKCLCSTINSTKSFSEKKSQKSVYTPPTGEDLKWRTPSSERPGEWYSKFKVFAPEKLESSRVMQILQSPISPSSIKNWYRRKKQEVKIYDQRFIPERHQILGNELAAAHFIIHRGGALKFYDDDKWMKRDENGNYDLPNTCMPNFIVEAIDLEGMDIQYEGLENLQGLKNVKFVSLKSCRDVDDWHLDRITGLFYKTLLELNIKACHKITNRGLEALGKLEKLQKLHIDQNPKNEAFELVMLALQDHNPKLEIIYD